MSFFAAATVRLQLERMLHSVELELEQVDCLPDEQQLLQQANVSPVFTSARPPCILLNELDFSPQAITSREGNADNQGTTNKSTGYFHSDVGVYSSSQYSSSYYSTSSSPPSMSSLLPSGEMKSLFRNSSWPDLMTVALDQSPRRGHSNDIYHQSQYQAQETFCRDENQSFPRLYEPHRNDNLEDCLPSLYEDDISGKEPSGFAAKSAPKKNSQGWSPFYEYQEEAPVSPFKESLYSLSPAVLDGKIIVSDNDLKLFSSSDASSAMPTGRAHQFNESSWESQKTQSPVYFSASSSPQKCYRTLETPRHRREKLFPQQTDSAFFVQQPPNSVSCSSIHQMIPFPADSVASSSFSLSNQNESKRHHAFRKQSPLPDAHRTSKTSQKTSSRANTALFARQSPLTEMTKKYAQHPIGTLTNSFSVDTTQPIPRLPGLQQHQHQSDYSRADPFKFGVPPIPQHWQTSNLNASAAQLYCASNVGYSGAAGFVVPALHQPLRVMGTRKIGIYSPEARRERIQRFLEKRKERVFHKRIKYDCRKRLANACPRIKGRFVRKQDAIQAVTSS
ncbi:Two-component response regulator aprr1, partial [Globisporangium splendens]